jgi:Fe2+ or Zn2+ uptake regulation protein
MKAEKAEQDLKNSTEYKQLKSLLDSGVLTKDEFESKVDLLKQKEKTNTYNNVDEKSILEINSEINKKHLEAYKEELEKNNSNLWSNIMKIILIILIMIMVYGIIDSLFK